MVSTVPAVSRFRPETGLKWIAGFFAFGLGLSALYATTGVGLPCPFRDVTGWDCPLCGGTRMGSALLHLEIGAAFAFNPLAMVVLIIVGSLGVLWTVQLPVGRCRPRTSTAGPGCANGVGLRAAYGRGVLAARSSAGRFVYTGGAARLRTRDARNRASEITPFRRLMSRQTRDSPFHKPSRLCGGKTQHCVCVAALAGA